MDGGDDSLVLAYGRGELVEQDRDVESRVALALRLDRTMEREQARTSDLLDEAAVEFEIELEYSCRVVAFACLDPELPIDLAQPCHEDLSLRHRKRRGHARREPLEVSDE